MDYSKLCMRCMKKSDDIGICPYCGKEKAGSKTWSKALAPGTILNKKILIGNILGKGGYGITYIGYDTLLEYPVAVKEFFPDEMVDRADDEVSVLVLDEVNKEEYERETEAYLREARVLAEFSKFPGIVSIKDLFYENNTGYLIMEFLDSGNLRKYIDSHGGWLGVKESLELMEPVISILGKLHSAGLIHRDVSPDNIMIDDDAVKLIDFGGSKRLGVSSQQVFLGKWGFAPLEQMLSKISEQGPWTDIYGICATLYCMMTGDVPQSSYERNEKDELVDIANYTITIEPGIARAIMKGLSMDAKNRQQSIDELYKDLYGIYPDEKGMVKAPQEASVEILRERSGRVWFGEYPMNEVVGTHVTSDIIYADYDEHDVALVGETRYLRLPILKDVTPSSGLTSMMRGKQEPEISGYRYFEFTKLPWRVVEQNKKRITLMSEYIIDFRPFDDAKYLKMSDKDVARVRSGIFWEKSKIREWLNAVFVKRAFTEKERAKLQVTPVNTPVSALSDRTTYDKVYLPSIEELRYGFDKNTTLQRGNRIEQPDENSPCSQYVGAMANGSLSNASYGLRSRGNIDIDGSYKVQEGYEGHAMIGGRLSPWNLNKNMGIRPVVCVNVADITDMA